MTHETHKIEVSYRVL